MWLHSLSSRQTAKPLVVPLTGQTASGHSVTYDPSVGGLGEDIDFYRYRYLTRGPRGPQPIDPIRCAVSDLYGNPLTVRSPPPYVRSRLACEQPHCMRTRRADGGGKQAGNCSGHMFSANCSCDTSGATLLTQTPHETRWSCSCRDAEFNLLERAISCFTIFCNCTSGCSLSQAHRPKPSNPLLLCGSLCNGILVFRNW